MSGHAPIHKKTAQTSLWFLPVCLASVLFLSGCGQKVKETLYIPGNRPQAASLKRAMVVLPFADYSYADNLLRASRRNLTIVEALTDRLVSKGFRLPVQEDVFLYLVDNKHIKLVESKKDQSNGRKTPLEQELQGGWSEDMKQEIVSFIRLENTFEQEKKKEPDDDPLASPGVHGLNKGSLARISRFFGARYIMRGRVIEYNMKKEHSWEPWRRGVLPFIYGVSDRVAFGVSTAKSYDSLQYQGMGSLIGLARGFSEDEPFSTSGLFTPGVSQTATTTTTANPATSSTVVSDFSGTTTQVDTANSGATEDTIVTTTTSNYNQQDGGTASADTTFADGTTISTPTSTTAVTSTSGGTTTVTEDVVTKTTPASGGLLDAAGLNRLFNSMVWGAVGSQTGKYLDQLARHLDKSHIPQAVIHLRVWVQDAASGQVVWTNRVEVKVSPESIFSDGTPEILFDTAIERAVSRLIDDFAASTNL